MTIWRAGPDGTKVVLDILMSIRMLKEQPDIIHVHIIAAPIVAVIGRYHRKIPMVYSAHNTMEEELPTYFHSLAKKCANFLALILDLSIPRLSMVVVIRKESIQKLRKLGCNNIWY